LKMRQRSRHEVDHDAPVIQQLLELGGCRSAVVRQQVRLPPNDRIDARKLAELLRTNQLKPVYHGEHGVRTLKELGRSYLTLTKDVTRVMNRIKALYRSWAIPCSGTTVYAPRHGAEWLAKIVEPGVRFGRNVTKAEQRLICVRDVCLNLRAKVQFLHIRSAMVNVVFGASAYQNSLLCSYRVRKL